MAVTITGGNRKLGKVANISLPPCLSCRKDAPCAKSGKCYALKAYRLYPSVRKAWGDNWKHYKRNKGTYWSHIYGYLVKHKPRHFRFHTAGDIPDKQYFTQIVRTARNFPNIKFLVFTKQYDIVQQFEGNITKNLSVVLSAWPGLALPESPRFPIAFMQDGTETRTDGTELECSGNCETCGMCWNLKDLGKNVVFQKH